MNRVKKIGKCLIIYIVISMMILSNFAYAGYTSAEVGGAVAGYTLNLLTWGNDENLPDGGPKLRYTQSDRLAHPTLDNPNPELPWYYDCSSFTAAMYNMVCNQEIMPWSSTTGSAWSDKFDTIGAISSALMVPGDVLLNASSHVEIFISDEMGSGGAHTNGADVNDKTTAQNQVDCAAENRGQWSISPSSGNIMRIKESVASTITDLNTEFAMVGIGSGGASNINYSNFFFNGIPDGKYSLASQKNIFSIIIDILANIVDYIIGLMTYIVRMVFVGWTAIFDNLLNWTVNTVTNTGTTAPEAGLSPTETSGTETSERSVTIETILFNKFDLLNINIFNTEGTQN